MKDKRKTKRQFIDKLVPRNQDDLVRQQMEEALRASVEQWYTTFNAMSDAICLLDPQGRIQRCNKAMVELLGKPLGEILDHHCWEVVHGTPEPIDECPFERTRKSLSREHLTMSLDDRWFSVSVDPLLSDNGQITGAVHVMRDITERKQIEEALREGEAKVRSIIEQSLDGIVLVDEQGIVIEWNQGEEKITGIKRQEALGEFIWNIQWRGIPGRRRASSSMRKRLESEVIEFLRTGEAPWGGRQVENEFQRPDGTRRFIQSVTFPIKTSMGFMIGNISRDVTERKQAEEILRRSKDNLARAQKIAHLGSWDWDIQNSILTWSDEVYRIFGVGRDFELTHESIEAMVHPDDRRMNQEKLDELLSSADSIEYELRIVRPEGAVGHIFQSAQASCDSTGSVSRAFGIMLDITERKQAEEALAEQAEQLRILSARLANAQEAERRRIARELHDQAGQNLTALGINLSVLRPHLAKAPDAAQVCLDNLLALVKETTSRIRGVIADLRPPELDDYGLLAALRWYAEQIKARADLAVTIEGEEPSPRLSSQSETAFFRIAQEALTNVVKHAQATRATVSVKTGEEIVQMTVADDGVGFDYSELEWADAVPHWGLLTMRERAQAIGAHWRVESSPGQGARVVVEIARSTGGE